MEAEQLKEGVYFFLLDNKKERIVLQKAKKDYPEIYQHLKEGETDFPMINGTKVFDGQNFACL
jgi:hypothetical protein